MWTVNTVPHPSIQAVPSNWLFLLCSVLNDELTLRAVKMMMIRNRYYCTWYEWCQLQLYTFLASGGLVGTKN